MVRVLQRRLRHLVYVRRGHDASWYLSAVDGADVLPAVTVTPESSLTIVATVLPSSVVYASTLPFDMRLANLLLAAQ